MQALLFLFAAAWLAHQGHRWPWAVAAALLAAAWAGTTLPDLDMALGLGHRSGLTHSVLPAAVAAGAGAGGRSPPGWRSGWGCTCRRTCFPMRCAALRP